MEDEVRDTIAYGDIPQREHLTNMRDIHNIKKQLNVHNVQKHNVDSINIDIWVKQLKENEKHNPILYYNHGMKLMLQGFLQSFSATC